MVRTHPPDLQLQAPIAGTNHPAPTAMVYQILNLLVREHRMMSGMLSRRLLLGCAIMFALAGCGSSHNGGSPKDPSDFQYNPPEGFKQSDKQAKNNGTYFLGPKDDGFTANLLVNSGTNSKDTAKQIGEQTLKKLASSSGVTVKEQEPYTIPDSDAYTWSISKALPTGITADQRQFVVMKNGIVIEFTMTASEKVFQKYDQALADSLQSFKWGK
jgi:hypothetical protein